MGRRVHSSTAARSSVAAWLALDAGKRVPSAVTQIKPRKQSKSRAKIFAFRLEGATSSGKSVIAKLTTESKARLEHHVYDALLSEIGAPAPACYGFAVEEGSGRWWLFVEEIEGSQPSRKDPAHLRALGAWLGVVTQGANALQAKLDLPNRDLGFVRYELEAALERVGGATAAQALDTDTLHLLSQLERGCDTLLRSWDRLAEAVSRWPNTLVHGDLTPKNIRFREGDVTSAPYTFDWEEAGWGNPAMDLAGLAGGAPGIQSPASAALLESYAAFARVFWPEVTLQELQRCLDFGRLLRLVRSITWATASLKPGFEKSKGARHVQWLAPWLESACSLPWIAESAREDEDSGSTESTAPSTSPGSPPRVAEHTRERDSWKDCAVDIWVALDGGNDAPVAVETLQEEKGRSVYRFYDALPDGINIVAKRCRLDEAAREAFVYQHVLPSLPQPALSLYGYVPDWLGSGWLFMEDAGTDVVDPAKAEDRHLAGRWLATLHTAGAEVLNGQPTSSTPDSTDVATGDSMRTQLRDRGPGFHREELTAALEALRAASHNPVLSGSEATLVLALTDRLERLAHDWAAVEDRYERSPIPETVVHGDFKEVHLCHRQTPHGPDLIAIDWNEAGWGRPAIDLAKFLGYPIRPSLSAYLSVAQDHWPEVDAAAVRQLGLIGEILRVVPSIRWAAERLLRPWVTSPISKLKYHLEWLERSVQELELGQAR